MDYTAQDAKGLEKAKALLLKHGFRIRVFACDCCNNPEIAVEHDGEMIVNTGLTNITMFPDWEV